VTGSQAGYAHADAYAVVILADKHLQMAGRAAAIAIIAEQLCTPDPAAYVKPRYDASTGRGPRPLEADGAHRPS
jgi:hypothetical protein